MDIYSLLGFIVLLGLLAYTLYQYFKALQKLNELKREINSQSLDYYLKKIQELGYDFTLKASPNKPAKSHQSHASSKSKKSKSFNDLIG